jgi:hypothetical protein
LVHANASLPQESEEKNQISTTDTSTPSAVEPQGNASKSFETKVAETAISLWDDALSRITNQTSSTTGTTQPADISEPSSQSDQKSDGADSTKIQLELAHPAQVSLVFDDISNSPAHDEIMILYSQGLLQRGNGKFYPDNYVRISDFIRVVMDAYRLQLGYNPSSLEGLSHNENLSLSGLPIEVEWRIESAYDL